MVGTLYGNRHALEIRCDVQWLLVSSKRLDARRSLLIWTNSAVLTGLEMFPVSSQKKYWTFVDETDLIRLRNEANRKFILKHGANMTVDIITLQYTGHCPL